MFKKVFALASFTALTGVIVLGTAAGCSSSTTSSTADPDTGKKPPGEGGLTDRAEVPDIDSGPATCPSTDPVNAADLPWAPPTPTQAGKCTEKNLTDFQQFIKDNPKTTNEQFEQYIKTQSATCHDCMFTDASKPTWGPIPMSGGKLLTLNIGACFALVSGNAQCGQAIQNAFDCDFIACRDCADDAAFTACRKKTPSGACKPFVQAIQSGCKGVPTTIDDVCGSFIQTARVQCVSATVDGGGDI